MTSYQESKILAKILRDRQHKIFRKLKGKTKGGSVSMAKREVYDICGFTYQIEDNNPVELLNRILISIRDKDYDIEWMHIIMRGPRGTFIYPLYIINWDDLI